MSENLNIHTEHAQYIKIFIDLMHRKTGELEPNQHLTFTEAPYIGRKTYDRRYICDVITDEDPDHPYSIKLWDYVSPIWYSKEEYTFDAEVGGYVRTDISAEPGVLETVPPNLYEWKPRPATALDLGRVIGILEYLEKDNNEQADAAPTHESDRTKSKTGSKVAKWILGHKQ